MLLLFSLLPTGSAIEIKVLSELLRGMNVDLEKLRAEKELYDEFVKCETDAKAIEFVLSDRSIKLLERKITRVGK